MNITRDCAIRVLLRRALLACIIAGAGALAAPQDNSTPPDSSQIIQFRNQTIDWYRIAGIQQEVSVDKNLVTVGTDNRQMTNQIVRLSFDFAHAEADSISKTNHANANPDEGADTSHDRALLQLQAKLDKQTQDAKTELEILRQQMQSANGKKRLQIQSQIVEVQAKLGLANARKEALRSMIEFASETSGGSRVGGLKAQIQAIAESLAEATSQASKHRYWSYEGATSRAPVVTAENSPSGIWICALTCSNSPGRFRMSTLL